MMLESKHMGAIWEWDTTLFADFQVVQDGDDWLVLFVFDRNIQKDSPVQTEKTAERLKSRNPLQGIPYRAIGQGMLMRYDGKGTPLWTNIIPLESWYYIPDQRGCPVLLLGAIVLEEQQFSGGQLNVRAFPIIQGVDKRSGQSRFTQELVNESTQSVQSIQELAFGFRIAIDPNMNQIRFITPRKTFLATFTEEE
jgi:hypothetical protein